MFSVCYYTNWDEYLAVSVSLICHRVCICDAVFVYWLQLKFTESDGVVKDLVGSCHISFDI